MKKIFLLLALIYCGHISSQIIYSESFSVLSLNTYTTGNATTLYTTVPAGFDLINDGHNNFASANNSPFNVPALKTSGWAVTYNSLENDTFLVGTSWLDTAQTVSRWVITPSATNITSNTVFTWIAKSPDAAFPESYEVYATNKTGSLTANDFTIGDRLMVVNEEKNGWTRHSINLSAFAGQTLRFAFKNISNDKFQIWIDDLSVITLPNSTDASLTSLHTNKYFITNTSQSIAVSFKNNGASSINALTLNYTYGSSAVITQTFSFASVAYAEALKLSIPQTFAISSPGNYPLKVWLTNPNNNSDQNTTNDTLFLNVTAQTSSPPKTILVEQFVSAMNGESADAQEKLKALESGSVIVVNIHDGDSLKEDNATGILSYKKQFATASIDRAYDDSLASFAVARSYYSNRIQKQLNSVTPASVSIVNKNYNSITRELSFTVKADFTGDAKGDYRFNAYLTERHVHGPTSDTSVNGYNQLSNYYNVPWSPYFQQGYFSSAHNSWVLNAGEYKHHNVLVHSFDQSFGTAGVIPQNGGTAGQSYQQTFTLTLPTSTNGVSIFNPENINIVGFLLEYGSINSERRIINAAQEKLSTGAEVVGLSEPEQGRILVYPNPAKDKVFVTLPSVEKSISIKIYDISGKLIMSEISGNTNILELNTTVLEAGIYLLEMNTANKAGRNRLIIEK